MEEAPMGGAPMGEAPLHHAPADHSLRTGIQRHSPADIFPDWSKVDDHAVNPGTKKKIGILWLHGLGDNGGSWRTHWRRITWKENTWMRGAGLEKGFEDETEELSKPPEKRLGDTTAAPSILWETTLTNKLTIRDGKLITKEIVKTFQQPHPSFRRPFEIPEGATILHVKNCVHIDLEGRRACLEEQQPQTAQDMLHQLKDAASVFIKFADTKPAEEAYRRDLASYEIKHRIEKEEAGKNEAAEAAPSVDSDYEVRWVLPSAEEENRWDAAEEKSKKSWFKMKNLAPPQSTPKKQSTKKQSTKKSPWVENRGDVFCGFADYEEFPESIHNAVGFVHEQIRDLARRENLPFDSIFLGGFSQGAALSLRAGLTFPDGKLGGIAAYSAWLLEQFPEAENGDSFVASLDDDRFQDLNAALCQKSKSSPIDDTLKEDVSKLRQNFLFSEANQEHPQEHTPILWWHGSLDPVVATQFQVSCSCCTAQSIPIATVVSHLSSATLS